MGHVAKGNQPRNSRGEFASGGGGGGGGGGLSEKEIAGKLNASSSLDKKFVSQGVKYADKLHADGIGKEAARTQMAHSDLNRMAHAAASMRFNSRS